MVWHNCTYCTRRYECNRSDCLVPEDHRSNFCCEEHACQWLKENGY